jgi:hypothetical protein
MSSVARNRTMSFAAAATLALGLALAGAGLAGDTSAAAASEDSSPSPGAYDGSVFCDPATLPEGAVCSLTPDKREGEADPAAQGAASEASTEPLPVSDADPGGGETEADALAGGAASTRAGEVGSVALARTGLRAWLPAVLGAGLLMGGVGLIAAQRRARLAG